VLRRQTKSAFYAVAGPAMLVNGAIYRMLRAPRDTGARAHLGPGQRNYIPGWVNVDANRFTGRCDVWADLRNKLPFRDSTLAAAYSHHVVEHLPDIPAHLRDVRRCLAPGGTYRIAVPHGDSAMRRFAEGNREWFDLCLDKRRSIGGLLESFVFCRGEHLSILTESYLREMLEDAGFEGIVPCMPTRTTAHPSLFGDCLPYEFESDFEAPHTLVLEASRPATSAAR